jgi:hypothetical protein
LESTSNQIFDQNSRLCYNTNINQLLGAVVSNKKVNLTLVDLDITQLTKISCYFTERNCNRGSVQGAYTHELRELINAMIDAGRNNKTEIVAPDLTIY